MASSRARAADIKLLISATVAVLLAGFFIAGGVFIATRSKNSVVCGQLNIGSATNVRQLLQSGGPYFQTGGAGCGAVPGAALGMALHLRVDEPLHAIGVADVGVPALPVLATRFDEQVARPEQAFEDGLVEVHVVDALERDLDA